MTNTNDDELIEVTPLPNGCGYMGCHFGAGYIDAECFGGQLYDLDDGEDDGMLYEPDEYIPCPKCNPEGSRKKPEASE